MAKQKNLGERIELKNNVSYLESIIARKDSRISVLKRNKNLQKKSHGRAIKEKNEKHKKVMEKVKVLEDLKNDLHLRLRAREKALAVANIYSRCVPTDEQQVMCELNDPTPIIIRKECIRKNADFLRTNCRKAIPRIQNIKGSFLSNSVGDKIDTMVSRTDKEISNIAYETQMEELIPCAGTPLAPILNERNLNIEETEDADDDKDASANETCDFYQVNTNTTNENKIEISREDEELHEKLDKMNERREKEMERERIELTSKHKQTDTVHGIEQLQIKSGNKEKERTETLLLEARVNATSINGKEKGNMPDDGDEKKTLLLAKIQAIEDGENPHDVTESLVNLKANITNKSKLLDLNLKNSKSNLNYSPSIRTDASYHSRKETDSLEKISKGKKSWEFKRTDENLHKGLPAHTDALFTSNRVLPPFIRNNNRSLTGFSGSCNNNDLSNTVSTNKKTPNRHYLLDTRYSPTALDTNIGQNSKSINKNNDINLFDQFENPFDYSTATETGNQTRNELQLNPNSTKFKNQSSDNSSSETQGRNRLFSETKNHKTMETSDSVVVDDLEEIFI